MSISSSLGLAPQSQGSTPFVRDMIRIQQTIEAGQRLNFDLGDQSRYIGSPEEIKEIPGAFRQHIKPDGSCWARALWQNTMSQVFIDPQEFDDFIAKIARTQHENNVPKKLVEGTIHILCAMRNQTDAQRIEYLNHVNVDNTLVFYARHVAANYMEKNFTFYTAADLEDIRTNIHRYGGPEVNAFARHFNLAVYTISKRSDTNRWMYIEQLKTDRFARVGIHVESAEFNLNNRKIMFGVHDKHFEVISFPDVVLVNQNESDEKLVARLQLQELEKAVQKQTELSSDMQGKLDTLADHLIDLRAQERSGDRNTLNQHKRDLARKMQEDCLACLREQQVRQSADRMLSAREAPPQDSPRGQAAEPVKQTKPATKQEPIKAATAPRRPQTEGRNNTPPPGGNGGGNNGGGNNGFFGRLFNLFSAPLTALFSWLNRLFS
ncbi:MAG: hypothetical protein H0W88_01675 [Parachlamydiaceae bacterium]|nr:hypothetical protein [Parachlamydiaceae bacterium]